jgi:hypothetical protein
MPGMMNRKRRRPLPSMLRLLYIAALLMPATRAQQPVPALPHDGSHDFDFELGTWKVHVERLVAPLTGSTTWSHWDGVSHVRKVWGGKANLVELEADGPSGHIEFLSLRLYNPRSRQWSLHYATSANGELATPSIGDFRDGRGEFYDQETHDGRAILVRGVLTHSGPDSAHFEQSFSTDGGRTWEVNVREQFTRLANASGTQ